MTFSIPPYDGNSWWGLGVSLLGQFLVTLIGVYYAFRLARRTEQIAEKKKEEEIFSNVFHEARDLIVRFKVFLDQMPAPPYTTDPYIIKLAYIDKVSIRNVGNMLSQDDIEIVMEVVNEINSYNAFVKGRSN